ncbi:MAG: DNA polymerase III subunit gamma/tau [Gammaproteobacteria bacterium]|nr:DNA polymerase III subunit gamma/tau [Gammaproteobacteria bacterium]
MSYKVLARKWRPGRFEEMVGQEHVLRALTNALDNDRLHHAYLFTGTRGVGKTTLARILAKALNCEKGVSSIPCGQCTACNQIDEGRFIDLIEVDAASRTKVDETRELLDNVQYVPSVGRYKVYLIDEVHMFSNHSFNALLKTLEEPPPHIIFLLVTTDPKKIPVTILSRCLQFNLKRLTPAQIVKQLTHILEQEQIGSDQICRRLIATAADGSLRDALSLLDQAIAFGGGELKETDVRAMLGTIDRREVLALMNALVMRDAPGLLARIDQIAEQNPDFDALLAELLSLLQRIAVYQAVPQVTDETMDDHETLVTLAKQAEPEEIQLYYQIGLVGRRDLLLAPDLRTGFEMIMLRMLAFTLEQSGHGLEESDSQLQAASSTPCGGHQAFGVSPTVADAQDPVSEWSALIDEMRLTGLVRELAGNCVLQDRDANRIKLVLPPRCQHLLNDNVEARLQNALKDRFGEDVRLVITVGEPGAETPVELKVREGNERQHSAERAIEGDSNVKALVDTFGAEVDKASIRPVHPENRNTTAVSKD